MEMIGGKGIMKLFVEMDMGEYLIMLRDFEVKKYFWLKFGFIVKICVLGRFYEFIE